MLSWKQEEVKTVDEELETVAVDVSCFFDIIKATFGGSEGKREHRWRRG